MILDYDKYRKYHVSEVPVRHKRKDLSKIDVKLTKRYREMLGDICSMDDRLDRFILSADDYSYLVQKAHCINIHGSTAQEGNTMSLMEVETLSNMMLSSCTYLRPIGMGEQQEIVNHLYSFYMTDLLHSSWDVNTLTVVHERLLRGTGAKSVLGEMRVNGDEFYIIEEGQMAFIGAASVHVQEEAEELMKWVEESPYVPAITAAVFYHEYESIHPFKEGSGKTGRVLLHALMRELGYRNFDLCRFEDKFLKDGRVYLDLLRYTDKTGDYTPLVEFFIDCIYDAYEEAVTLYAEKDVLRDLDENTRALAIRFRESKGWFSLSDAKGWIEGLSEQSVRNKLNTLVDIGVIEKKGQTRSLMYRFADPFAELKEALFAEGMRINITRSIDEGPL